MQAGLYYKYYICLYLTMGCKLPSEKRSKNVKREIFFYYSVRSAQKYTKNPPEIKVSPRRGGLANLYSEPEFSKP